MSQRQILTGGVRKTDILPLPTLFAEPASLFFTNRDDTATFTDTEAVYTNITGISLSDNLFVSWFAGVSSENGDGIQAFRTDLIRQGNKGANSSAANSFRPRSGQPVNVLTGASFGGTGDNTAYDTTVEQTVNGSPLGGVRAAGIVGIPLADMGVAGQDVYAVEDFSGTAAVANNDVDSTRTASAIDIQGTEEYIVFWRYGGSGQSFEERNLRFSPQIDGVDLHRARTDNTSGGATRSGRGFSVHLGPVDNAEQVGATAWAGAAVVPIQKGLRTPRFVASVAENVGVNWVTSRDDMVIVRKAMFEQAEITKVTTRVSNTSETPIDTPFEVAINSTGKVMVIFSSSCMSGQTGPEVQLYRENAGGGGGVELIQPIEITGQGNTDFVTTAGTASTDADLLPLYMLYVDDNPGDVVYKLRLGRSSAGSDTNFINVKDDGTDGFEGYLMALELSFGTDT